MASLDRSLSVWALAEIVSFVPVTSHWCLRTTCKDIRSIMGSECFARARQSLGMQVLVLRLESREMLAKFGYELVEGFLHPELLPVIDSIRIEPEFFEWKPWSSFCGHLEEGLYRFLQLRVGGVQVPAQQMHYLFPVDRLDPVEAGPLRRAWWDGVRSVINGLAIPPDARILLLGKAEQEFFRNMHCERSVRDDNVIMALVSTGNDFGVLKFVLERFPKMVCSMVCGGGIQEETVKQALRSLISGRLPRRGRFEARRKPSSKIDSFSKLIDAFEVAVDKMLDSAQWNAEWNNDGCDRFDSRFSVHERPDLGPWCFGP
eukprot:Skav229424  [mRNA]  locus=scaffold2297:255178:256128:+ [translate_table: standard]